MPTTEPIGANNLALLGGRPAFAAPQHVNKPNIGDREMFLDLVEDILDRRWFSNDGPLLSQFESELAARVGVRHCVAVSSGTMALALAAKASGLSGEVIVPSFTFAATAHALAWVGLRPVFVDVDPETWTLDPRRVTSAVTMATSGLIGVHLFGRACDTIGLERVAAEHGLRVLYDAAHAFGTSHGGKPVGSFGDAEVFSFHATKVLHSFEGGAVMTDSDEIAATVRQLRNFGFSEEGRIAALGTNGKMPEVSAAMGLANLRRLDGTITACRRVFHAYQDGLAAIPGVLLRQPDEGESNNWHYVVVEVDAPVFGLTADELAVVLTAENILARRYFSPACHELEPYRSLDPDAKSRLPVTVQASGDALALPAGAEQDVESVATICQLIHLAQRSAAKIRSAGRGAIRAGLQAPGMPGRIRRV